MNDGFYYLKNESGITIGIAKEIQKKNTVEKSIRDEIKKLLEHRMTDSASSLIDITVAEICEIVEKGKIT